MGILTNSDNKAVRFCWLFRQFASASVRTWSQAPSDVVAGTSTALCRHQRCVQSTPATACGHTAADLCVWNHNIASTCRVYFSHRTHLSPLKSCLDFSSRWQNSKTSFLSCSSVDSIFTMPFSAAPKCYVCEPVVLLGNEGNRLKSSCRK